jgi:hypothetical protein
MKSEEKKSSGRRSALAQECVCGSIVKNMLQHIKTKKHQKFEDSRIEKAEEKEISVKSPIPLNKEARETPAEIAFFTVWRRPALKKTRANPEVNVLECARKKWPERYLVKADYVQGQAVKAVVQFNSLKHFMDIIWTTDPKKEANFYEIISGRMREAYDVEFLYDSRPDLVGLTIDQLLLEFTTQRNAYLEQVSEEWLGLQSVSPADLIVLNSSNDKKFSVHILFPDTCTWAFSTPRDAAKWQRGLAEYMKKTSFFSIDASGVGRNDGLFRTIFSTKIGAGRPLTVYQKGKLERREEYFVCTPLPSATAVVHAEQKIEAPVLSEVAEGLIKSAADRVTALLQKNYGSQFDITKGRGNIWRLNRNGRTSVCLVEGTHVHTDNHFAHISKKGDLVIRCFQHEGAVIIAQNVVDIPFEAPKPEVLKSATHFIDGYINEEEYKAIVQEHDIIIDARNTGAGKTFSVLRYAKSTNEDFIVIHHRRSLDVDYKEKYNLESYRDKFSELGNCSIVVNSLAKTIGERYGGNIHAVGNVIIDEIRSVLRQLEMQNIQQDTSLFLDFIQYHKKPLICLDANVRDSDVEYIQSLRPGARIAVIADASKEAVYDIEVSTVGPASLKFVAPKILEEYSGQKLIVPYSCDVLKMETILELTGRSFINIHKNTREELYLTQEELDKYEIIAHSTTWSEGVSFDSPLFADRVNIGFFSSCSCGPESASQMMRRFRHVKKYKAVLGISNVYPRFTNEEGYYSYASAAIKALEKLDKKWNVERVFEPELGRSIFKINKDEFWRLHSKNMVESELDRCNYFDVFVQKLANNKFNVSYEKGAPETSKGDRDAFFQMHRGVLSENYTKMLAAPTISSKEEYDAAKNAARTEEENLALEKYYITSNALVEEPEVEPLSYFGQNKPVLKGMPRVREIFKLKPMDEVIKGMGEKRIESLSVLENQGLGGFVHQREGFLKIAAVQNDVLHTTMKALGFPGGLLDLGEIDELDEKGIDELFTLNFYIQTCKLFWRRPSKKEYNELHEKGTISILKLINDEFLSKLALSVIYDPRNQKWRQVCIARYMDAARSHPRGKGRGVLINGTVDKELGDKLNETFLCADEIVEHEGEPLPLLIAYLHIFRKEDKKEKKKKNYICECCKKEFGNRKIDWSRHSNTCQNFPCPTCDMVFRRANHFKEHICFRFRNPQ